MKQTRHTPEQIIRKLKSAEQLIAQVKFAADVSGDFQERCHSMAAL